jgi:hypothetical protein
MGSSIFPLVKLAREIVINPAGRAFGTMLDLNLSSAATCNSDGRPCQRLILSFFDARENPRGKAFRLIGLRVEKIFLTRPLTHFGRMIGKP